MNLFAVRGGTETAVRGGTEPFALASIDYHAANEYVEAHYGNSTAKQNRLYFARSRAEEPIYNARTGVWNYDDKRQQHATMEYCGFQLMRTKSLNIDYRDLEKVRQQYLPEMRLLLDNAYGTQNIRHVIFWNPVWREGDLEQVRHGDQMQTPTSHFVSTVHIDQDIGAYESAQDLVDLFAKNHMHGNDYNIETRHFREAIQKGHRFAICNFWKNTGSGPVQSAPLALFSVRYTEPLMAFPEMAPDPDRSRWYTYPQMTADEVLLFCQYDRDVTRPSDMWHCALTEIGDASVPRCSFDVRCLIVFDDIVPLEHDRFSATRKRPNLTQKESERFCTEQSKRRRSELGQTCE